MGVACFLKTRAFACSSRTEERYCFTERWAAGFPTPRTSFQSSPLPASIKMERNFPIKLSTVPAASLVGHWHRALPETPKRLHWGRWILVFPPLSFQIRNLVRSWGEADRRDLGKDKEWRKRSSSRWRLDFCFWYGLSLLTFWRALRRSSMAARSKLTFS